MTTYDAQTKTRDPRPAADGPPATTHGRAAYCLVLTLLLGAATALPAAAQFAPEGESIVAGQTVTLNMEGADTLIITHRPGSNISRVEHVPVTEAEYSWTPATAGLVALSTPGGPVQTISVRFDRAPVAGLVILLLAAGILFGGAGFASFRLFGKQPGTTLTDRPDT